MAFEPSDFEDLVRFLDAHPDMRDQLRRRILSDDFLHLPIDVQELRDALIDLSKALTQFGEAQQRTFAVVSDLAEAQQRTFAVVSDLAEAQQRTFTIVSDLAEAQQRTFAVVSDLAEAQQRTFTIVSDLADAQQRTFAVVADLVTAQRRTDEAQQRTDGMLSRLLETQQRTDFSILKMVETLQEIGIKVAEHDGDILEDRFRRRAQSYFGVRLKRPRLVAATDLDRVEAALDAGEISEQEFDALLSLDAIVIGRDRRAPDSPETVLAIEVSVTIHEDDVERAVERAAILTRVGYRALAVVGGRGLTERAGEMASDRGVIVRISPLAHSAH